VAVAVAFLRGEGQTAPGVAVDASVLVARRPAIALGVVGDFGLHRFNDLRITSMGAGARVTGRAGRDVQPFGQMLLGLERCCGSRDVFWQPGGGVDVRLTDRINVRGQLDVRLVRVALADAVTTVTETRFLFGVSMPLGRD
jgi:hypothetical protein